MLKISFNADSAYGIKKVLSATLDFFNTIGRISIKTNFQHFFLLKLFDCKHRVFCEDMRQKVVFKTKNPNQFLKLARVLFKVICM